MMTRSVKDRCLIVGIINSVMSFCQGVIRYLTKGLFARALLVFDKGLMTVCQGVMNIYQRLNGCLEMRYEYFTKKKSLSGSAL